MTACAGCGWVRMESWLSKPGLLKLLSAGAKQQVSPDALQHLRCPTAQALGNRDI